MSRDIDHIVEVNKNIDEIQEVQKFNPFHDSKGWFASSNGFKTYSANPNTRAGAMAIARSAAAGHGNTANVHRQSYGENIRQNANWIGRGKQVGPRQQGAATLRQRVEPAAGLGGASATGASWQAQNQAQGRTTGPSKQPAKPATQKPAQQKPAQQQTPANQPDPQQSQQPSQTQNSNSLASDVADVKLSSADKLAIVPRNFNGQPTSTEKLADSHYQQRVAGKDISDTLDVTKVKGTKDPIDKIVELQGWNKSPTVTDDLEMFQAAAKKSGCVLFRSVGDSYTGESADQVCKKVMSDGNTSLGGKGAKYYGTGLYMVKTDFGTSTGNKLAKNISRGQAESYGYGPKQMSATIHPNAKIATPNQSYQMKRDFMRMPGSQQRKYGDYGGYIASKGFDGAQWHDSSDPSAYATIYNKSALIFYSGVASKWGL